MVKIGVDPRTRRIQIIMHAEQVVSKNEPVSSYNQRAIKKWGQRKDKLETYYCRS